MKTAIACNTTWNQGGQGVFLAQVAEAVSQVSDLTVFCAELRSLMPLFPVHSLGKSSWSPFLSSLPVIRRRKDWIVLLSDLHFDRQLNQYFQNANHDLFITVAGQSYHSMKAAKRKSSTTWLYCLNSYLPFMQQQVQQEVEALQDITVSTMHPIMLKRFAQECQIADLILLNSHIAKQTFLNAGFPPEKLAVVTPAVDPHRFRSSPKSDDVFRVLYVGTIEPRKGVHYLIPAFLQANLPNSELLLVGGVSTRALRLLLQNTLNNYPSIQQEFWDFSVQDPTQVYGRSSTLVLPSVEDGFGLVALEAMASGLPVIVTSHCGAADLVRDGVNGFVVPPRDPAAIAKKLTFLAENESVRVEMGKAARAIAEQHTQADYNHNLHQIFVTQGMAV